MACVRDVLENVRADDFVEYFLFSLDILKGDDASAASLKRLHGELTDIFGRHANNYIWQKDEFNLIPRNISSLPPVMDNEESLPPHMYGVTHYGDNIEDEWFIVYLLTQLTKSVPKLVARVVDTDGEFLLIEAANHLPKWASPEVCDKRGLLPRALGSWFQTCFGYMTSSAVVQSSCVATRVPRTITEDITETCSELGNLEQETLVYIYNGEVHMIPMEDEDESVTVGEALAQIKSNSESTRASPEVQDAIQSRIKGYPDKILELLHQTNAYVPAGVAALLKERPSLIAPAVTAFCHRDPIDMRACRAMRYFPPETRVMTQVKMTRCLYAMLLHHKYSPDRRTGWHLPPPTSPEYLAHSIGVKLACGFEILVSQCKGSDSSNDLSNDRGWLRYKQSLTDKGYFKGLLEGSQEYKRLEKEGIEYYKTSMVYSQPAVGQVVLDLLNSLDIDLEEMRKAGSSLPPPDDDSWMEISAEEFEKSLAERYGTRPECSPSEIPNKLTSFLGHISGIEGVEHPLTSKDGVPLRPKRGAKKQNTSGDDSTRDEDNNRISFDQEAFSCAVQNILDFVVPEDSWDLESEGSGMSAYEDEVEMDLSRKKTTRRTEERNGSETETNELKQYMDQMDRELANTTMGQSFHKKISNKSMEDSFSDIESFEPVDIDMNSLRNILESYQSQMGGAGPASNLLGSMGVRLHDK